MEYSPSWDIQHEVTRSIDTTSIATPPKWNEVHHRIPSMKWTRSIDTTSIATPPKWDIVHHGIPSMK